MAEDKRRSFDLKSWQGLTDVLRFARESNLDPVAYAEFRNLVLHYAQLKGSDPELKKNIETIISSFPQKQAEAPEESGVSEKEATAKAEGSSTAKVHGRRLVPSFTTEPAKPHLNDVKSGPVVEIPKPKQVVPVPPQPEAVPDTSKVIPVPPPETPPQSETLKSVEEHRTRIMEIKRRVNGLVGNPITLMDHGNHIGREYMGALLNALKATSPGSTLDVEDTMANLERMFTKVLEVGSHAQDTVETKDESPALEEVVVETKPVIEEPVIVEEPSPVTLENIPEPTPEPEPAVETTVIVEEPSPVMEESVPEPVIPEPEVVTEVLPPEPVIEEPAALPIIPEPEPVPQQETPAVEVAEPQQPVTPKEDKRWSESGGDVDVATQIKILREQLKAKEMSTSAHTTAARATRPVIPSIIDMEEEPVPQVEDHVAETTPVLESQVPGTDEMSTESLTHRPLSSMTGITLGTPQTELMTPEVTNVLTQLLHDWSIFASSGLFGMGPSGADHPLYQKLSRLPMGEVLSGRFEDGDMKLVRVIKDYVDAWRHEQGIAYNPTETFEHYLRRVSQRILKRQSGAKTV